MWKRIASLTLALLAASPCTRAEQKQKPGAQPPTVSKTTELTSEQKEILKHREMLENLELLMNFEKIKYLDFFAGRKDATSKEKPVNSQAKENAVKNPK